MHRMQFIACLGTRVPYSLVEHTGRVPEAALRRTMYCYCSEDTIARYSGPLLHQASSRSRKVPVASLSRSVASGSNSGGWNNGLPGDQNSTLSAFSS